jgi:ferredoxin
MHANVVDRPLDPGDGSEPRIGREVGGGKHRARLWPRPRRTARDRRMTRMSACRITVDETRCAASTTCVLVAPDLFEIPSGADSAHVRTAVVEGDDLIALARDAEESCPTLAIVVEPVA